jgi:hypothetical protein
VCFFAAYAASKDIVRDYRNSRSAAVGFFMHRKGRAPVSVSSLVGCVVLRIGVSWRKKLGRIRSAKIKTKIAVATSDYSPAALRSTQSRLFSLTSTTKRIESWFFEAQFGRFQVNACYAVNARCHRSATFARSSAGSVRSPAAAFSRIC